MPANGLRVNHYDSVALHLMWIIFLKGYCVLVRVEIIHKSKFLPGTVEKNYHPKIHINYACSCQLPP